MEDFPKPKNWGLNILSIIVFRKFIFMICLIFSIFRNYAKTSGEVHVVTQKRGYYTMSQLNQKSSFFNTSVTIL